MKTTDNFISRITEEARMKRNENATKYYQEHNADSKVKSLLNYYKRKYGEECIEEYIEKYGKTSDCINAIKQNTKKSLPKLENI